MHRFIITSLVAVLSVANIEAFITHAPALSTTRNYLVVLKNGNENNDNKSGGGGGGFMDGFMKKLDQQVDDFLNKRMGNGEVFYGKRKANPSGNVEGDYNGMGLTDRARINGARVRKEEFQAKRAEERRLDMERRGLL